MIASIPAQHGNTVNQLRAGLTASFLRRSRHGKLAYVLSNQKQLPARLSGAFVTGSVLRQPPRLCESVACASRLPSVLPALSTIHEDRICQALSMSVAVRHGNAKPSWRWLLRAGIKCSSVCTTPVSWHFLAAECGVQHGEVNGPQIAGYLINAINIAQRDTVLSG